MPIAAVPDPPHMTLCHISMQNAKNCIYVDLHLRTYVYVPFLTQTEQCVSVADHETHITKSDKNPLNRSQ